MQCFSDLNLQCCECHASFTSASKLLHHFADHALKNFKIKVKNDALYNVKRKKRDNKQVSLVQSELGSDSSSSRQESTLTALSDSCSEASIHDQPHSCKLAKFDLEQRLQACVKQESEPNIKQEPIDTPDYKEAEEYGPLKFCTITMEEGGTSNTSVNNSQKKGTSRKQLLPKKIERNVDVLRKLAPKPCGAITSSENQPHSPVKKKYACHLCTKVFGWSTDLKRHILVHTGERPFKCKNCQATFTRNFLLQKHQSKVHPCKPKEPSVTPEVLELPNTMIEHNEDPLKEEPVFDEEEDKSSNSSSDSKWHIISAKTEMRCSDIKQSEIFSITPIKVLST